MSAELIAILAAAVSLGGLVSAQIAGVRGAVKAQGDSLRADIAALDGRVRAVETGIAYLRGLLQGGSLVLPPKPEPPANDQGAA